MKRMFVLPAIASGLLISAAFIHAPTAVAERGSAEQSRLSKIAIKAAQDAQTALDARKYGRAISQAERAVAAMPQSADYRFLLGEAYLASGRFASARAAFADALSLKPDHDRAILKLALADTALGKRDAARELLESNRSLLSTADYGLALALAGDPQGAIAALSDAIRAGESNAKTRQNIAFAYAMAGQWAEARAMASMDLPGDMVSNRIGEWAQLASPRAPWDQVAAVLGIRPQADPGLPVALALSVTPPSSPLPEESEAVQLAQMDAAVPSEPSVPAPLVPAQGVVAEPANSVATARQTPLPESRPTSVVADAFIVDYAKDAPALLAPKSPAQGNSKAPRLSKSGFVVQLGAYRTAKGAEAGWTKVSRRWSMLRDMDGRQAEVTLAGGTFFRLSVGGFSTRKEATQLCASIKWDGGQCFVRALSNSDAVRWVARATSKNQQFASR